MIRLITVLTEEIVKVFTTKDSLVKYSLFLTLTLLANSCNSDVKELTIRVRSRMHLGFQEDHKVRMYEKFPLSDTDLEAVVVEFFADFSVDTLNHKAFSKSDTLNNPAAKILIVEGQEKKEEVWAFRPGLIPHFSPRSFIGFEIVDFKAGGKYKQPSGVTTEQEIKDE